MKPCKSGNFFVKGNDVVVIAGGSKILPPERVYDTCLFLVVGKKKIHNKQMSKLFSRFNLQFTIGNIYTCIYFIIMKILTDFRKTVETSEKLMLY